MLLKKLRLGLELLFLKIMQRVNYRYFKKHYPYFLRRMGVKFSGDIDKTGFIATSVKFDSLAYTHLIEVGEETIISDSVYILVHDYSIATAIRTVKPVVKGALPHFLKGVKIGNNVFVGARSIILPGTTIGDNTIIAAGAVVKGNIPSGVIVAGNPARILRTTEEYANAHLQLKDFIGKIPDEM